MKLGGKKILLGVTGGIAAYKAASLVRLFIKSGAEVNVVMTSEAEKFITPLTLSTLSKNPVYTQFTKGEEGQWNNHVALGKWADFMIIAPLTADTLAKMATGQSDNFLLAVYLSADCPVYAAPAMDLDMYQHPTTAINLKRIETFGNYVVPAQSGELASGLHGQGRMAEPEDIFNFITDQLKKEQEFSGQHVLITAGPTYEAIDPVRYIGNHSSGKMGFALAETAAEKGADVTLVTGPTQLKAKHKNIETISITSAKEMFDAVHKHFRDADIVIASAAVSDYKPKTVVDQKLKKNDSEFTLTLEQTDDILLSLGKNKKDQFLVGFAMETENEVENAQNKLHKKNLDFIVLNSLADEGAGFGVDTNKVKIVNKEEVKAFDVKPKKEVAADIFKQIAVQKGL